MQPGRQPKTKTLFIPQCYDTFSVLGRRKQHIVLNVAISFVSSVDRVPWWRLVSAVVSLSSHIAHSIVRICFHFNHWNCEPKCDSVNLHAVPLNINPLNAKLSPICHLLALVWAHRILHISRVRVKKNNNIGVLVELLYSSCLINVLICVNLPNIYCYIYDEFTPKLQRKFITPIVKKAYKLYYGC